MKLNSLHVLLTYQCNYECAHCFVWGSPQQSGVLTLAQLEEVFQQARGVRGLDEFYFEGGETFLYFPILLRAVRRAHALGFRTGVVTNGYWATGVDDARAWLEPLVSVGLDKLEISVDALHGSDTAVPHPAVLAAHQLGLPVSRLSVHVGDEGGVMYRGRAVAKLVNGQPRQPWPSFTTCPYENLIDPGRVHLDPFGNLHICQGIVIGNLFAQPLAELLANHQPEQHPILRALVAGGPSRLVREYRLDHLPGLDAGYVDACHLCYTARQALRPQFPAQLAPDQMYGVPGT